MRAAGAVRVVSILFADLVGSTRLLHALDPEDARDVLDAALQVVKDGIHAFGGAVARVQGDGVMAVFGMMPAVEDHALRAALAACRIRDGMQSRGGATLPGPQLRIGVHSGPILLRWQDNDFGSILDVVGEAAHIAGRVEQLCPPGSVAISAPALDLLAEATSTRPLGELAPSGGGAAMAVAELEQVLLSQADLLPVKGKTTHALVGREPAMIALRQLIRAIVAPPADLHGSVPTLGLIGEPGMGKSRLLAEAAQLARQAGLRFVAIRGNALLRDVPLGCFMPPFRYLAGKLAGDAADGMAPAESACLAGLLDGGAAPDRSLPPDERNRLVHETITAVLRLASAREPLVLLVDDLQYIDSETGALLRELVQRAPATGLDPRLGPRLGMVLAGRPESAETLGGIATRTVPLAPLAPAEARSLVRAALGRAEATGDDPIVDRIAARSAGLPLAIEEFAALVAGHPAGAGDDHDGAMDDSRLPARLESLFLHRIDSLEPEARQLCLHCSAMGPVVSLDRMRRLAPAIGLDLDRAIDALVEKRILEPDFAGHVRFTHQLVQEAGYRTLSRAQRAELHAGLYAALLADARPDESRTGEGRASHAELAHHAEAAGLFEQALRHLWKACEDAVALAAIETVHAIYRRAGTIAARMGDGAGNGGGGAARFALLAFDALQQLSLEQETRGDMLALADGTVDLGPDVRTIAQINMALLEWINGAPSSARRYLAVAGHGLAQSESLPRRVYADLVAAYVDYALAEPRAAFDRLARLTDRLRAGHAAETFGAVVVVPHILALSFGAWYATDLGEEARAQAWIAEATAISETLEHNYSRLLARLAHGYFHYRAGRLDEAIAILRKAHEHCIAHQFLGFEPVSVAWLALSLIARGDSDEAGRLLADSIARGRYLQVRTSATYYHYEARCRLEMARGQVSAAIDLAADALRHCRDNEERLHELHALVLREEVMAWIGGRDAQMRGDARADLAARVSALGLAPLRARLEALGPAR